MSAPSYDLVVIGSGPGGYAAALAGARRGLRVGLVEREHWGGVCLNVGCIPTKALASVAHMIRKVQQAQRLGIMIREWAVDYPAVRARNERIVSTLRRGLTELLQRERVELIEGVAAFEQPTRLVVTRQGQSSRIEASRIVIATGGRPVPGPWTFDERKILSYRGVLSLTEIPRALLIIGGGAIGCEFASIFSALGSRVTIVEQQPQLLPADDPDAVRWLTRRFQQEGVTVSTGTTVQELAARGSGVAAALSDGTHLEVDAALIAIGQRPNIASLQLEAGGIQSGRGVQVDPFLRTSQPHVAAIGDCLEGHGLAHWASAEGGLAVRNLLGDPMGALDATEVPRCVFADPELAHIGPLESQVKDRVRAVRFSFGALGKSHCDEETEGFVKLLVDPATDRLRGATIVGTNASSLIHYAVLAVHQGLTAKQLAKTITAHPTMPEAITEAAASVYGESLVVAARPHTRAQVP
ncbi:MAG: dihydrolipoyl dehydrogenase [Candidatus Omnitrophica bacterium CG11_big_fil_rev_8_21_14_0_20_63_9]|nr:MAG: dihydrolipoyl dehydrogenase [Candidatus Omnitrophica bacterium CG11_big_fil_rev_8_21_14_0_20_63_9]